MTDDSQAVKDFLKVLSAEITIVAATTLVGYWILF